LITHPALGVAFLPNNTLPATTFKVYLAMIFKAFTNFYFCAHNI
jgi:hypothetical protein